MATRPKQAETVQQYLVKVLQEYLDGHDSWDHLRIFDSDHFRELSWNPKTRVIQCLLWTGDQVQVRLPFAWGEGIRPKCDCYLGPPGHAHCSRCHQLVQHILLMLEEPGGSSVASEIRGLPLAPAWNWTFRLLDGLHTLKSSDAQPAAPPQCRLTWRIGLSEGPTLSIGAWEQRISKNTGKWTGGRRIFLDKLLARPELLALEGDRQAAAKIYQNTGYYHPTWSIDPFHALEALVGHPDVFLWDEPKRRVTVERSDLGLSVNPHEGGLSSDGSLGGHTLRSFPDQFLIPNPHGIVGFLEEEGRFLVAPAQPEVVHILFALRKHDQAVPLELQEDLFQRLGKFEDQLPVGLSSDLVQESLRADDKIILRLRPAETSGLIARLLVRPSPRNPYYAPGEGPDRLLALREGRQVTVERTLPQEIEEAQEQVDLLQLERQRQKQPWIWHVSRDEDALDLVLAAQAQVERGGLMVEWPEGGRRKINSAFSPTALKVKVRDQKDWFGVDGNVEGDGWKVPILAILQAWREGRRYVPVGDGNWAMITGELRQRLAALDDVVHVRQKKLQVGATAAPVLRQLASDGTLTASRRFQNLVRQLEASEQLEPDPPESLTAHLRDYQLDGYRWLRRLSTWGVGGCLADDMGLGKTVQTLAVLLDRQQSGPALVIAPTSVGFNWLREAERFAPGLHVGLYRQTDRDTVFNDLRPGDVLVATYGLVLRDIEKLATVQWTTLVLDEAQAIKNSRTKTAQAVRRLQADWCVALTGTPVENHLGELWSLFHAISPGLFGGWQSFSERFAKPIEKDHDLERRRALARVLRPFVLRRTKSEVLTELPARTEVQLTVELGDVERQLYEDTRLKILQELAEAAAQKSRPRRGRGKGKKGQNDQRFQVLAGLTRLRQLACHPALVDADWTAGSAKLRLLIKTIEELRDGEHRALVFSQFTRHLALVKQALDDRDIRYQYLDGQTTPEQREERIDQFQDGAGDVFLISLKAGGTGLNLTAADYVIHLDPWWNPAVEDQATDRAHRIGQSRPVTVYRLVTRGTIEEEILSLHASKRDLVAGVLAGADKAGKLSTSELVELIRAGGSGQPAPLS